jgi:hypothetical protein
MEARTSAAPLGPSTRARFTVLGALGDAWIAWSRNAGPLLAIAALLSFPLVVSEIAQGAAAPAVTSAYLLPLGLLETFFMLATTGAIALAGLRAARGRPIRVAAIAGEGLRRWWLTLKVLFLSLWAITVVGFVIGLFFSSTCARALRGAGATPGALPSSGSGYWMLIGGQALGYALAMRTFYPALAVALAEPGMGARAAVRRARELTHRARGRVFGFVLLLQCVELPAAVLYRSAQTLSPGASKTAALAAYVLLAAALTSFVALGPAIIHRALAREIGEGDADLESLREVFA